MTLFLSNREKNTVKKAIFVTAMARIKRIIFKLLIVLIALLCIDGGRSVLSSGISAQLLKTEDHINDIELPCHHNHYHFYDYEKWAGSPEIDLANYSDNFIKFPNNLNPLVSEFHDSIWQPPENS
jgi:hypothetical protein